MCFLLKFSLTSFPSFPYSLNRQVLPFLAFFQDTSISISSTSSVVLPKWQILSCVPLPESSLVYHFSTPLLRTSLNNVLWFSFHSALASALLLGPHYTITILSINLLWREFPRVDSPSGPNILSHLCRFHIALQFRSFDSITVPILHLDCVC